jgi:hypothetical protein
MAAPKADPLCPSAPAEADGARAFAIVAGTAAEPRSVPLERPLPATPELLAMALPARPTEVFRFAARCAGGGCRHFAAGKCSLATKVVQMLPAVADALPVCAVRADCMWFRQEGRSACMRCPQIVTQHANPDPVARRAADPTYREAREPSEHGAG